MSGQRLAPALQRAPAITRGQRSAAPAALPALGAGDPLVLALAVCIRQAHVRRQSQTTLD